MARIIMQQLSKNSSVAEKLLTIYCQVGNSVEQGPEISDTVLLLCCTFINNSKRQKAWSSRQEMKAGETVNSFKRDIKVYSAALGEKLTEGNAIL